MGGITDGLFGGGAGQGGQSQSQNQTSTIDQTVTENQTQSNTGTQEKNPWGPQGNYLTDIWGQAQGLANQGTTGPNANQTAGWGQITDFANGGAQENYNNLQGSIGFLTNPNQLYADSNPYLQSNIDAATNAIQQNLGQGLNQIDQNAVMAGNLGGSRQGVAQGQAIEQATQQAGDVASQMALDNYYSGMNNIMQGAQLNPILNQMGYGQGQAVADVGQQQYAQTNPWNDLLNYAQVVQSGNWGQTTNQNSVTQSEGSQRTEGTNTTQGTTEGTSQSSPLDMFGNFASGFASLFG